MQPGGDACRQRCTQAVMHPGHDASRPRCSPAMMHAGNGGCTQQREHRTPPAGHRPRREWVHVKGEQSPHFKAHGILAVWTMCGALSPSSKCCENLGEHGGRPAWRSGNVSAAGALRGEAGT
eukprot:365814-Chlamydomonas_euryale.AAC.4